MLELPVRPARELTEAGIAPYARLLGFRKASSQLIKRINETCHCEVINKLSDAKTASPLLESDVRAARLYDQIVFEKFGVKLADEYKAGVVIC